MRKEKTAEEKQAIKKRFELVLKLILAAILLVALVRLVWFSGTNIGDETKHKAGAEASEDFAKCLKDKGAIMYGDDTCEYCQTQKKIFGSAFSKINYVNCYFNKDQCEAAGVKGYPFWKMDEKTLSGIQTFSSLAALTGCSEPKE